MCSARRTTLCSRPCRRILPLIASTFRAGNYQVDLLFAEMKFDKPGERVFDVKVNGKPVLEKLDLVKQAGAQQAFIQQCRVSSTGGINIEFNAVKGKPILSGVRIKRMPISAQQK